MIVKERQPGAERASPFGRSKVDMLPAMMMAARIVAAYIEARGRRRHVEPVP